MSSTAMPPATGGPPAIQLQNRIQNSPPVLPSTSFTLPASSSAAKIGLWTRLYRKINIGTTATVLSLCAALIFGPPAWKLAVQSIRLSMWTACADHPDIQNTTSCKRVLSKNFDTIGGPGKRSLDVIRVGIPWRTLLLIIFACIITWWILSIIRRASSTSSGPIEDSAEIDTFHEKELNSWYKGFLKDCPSGLHTRVDFLALYRKLFPNGDSTIFANLVFDTFDSDLSGCIDFGEFIRAFSITSRGKLDDKLEWVFQMYDLNGDGVVSFDELPHVVRAIYQMIGTKNKLPKDEDIPEKRAAKLFRLMGKDRNESLNRWEFSECMKKDERVLLALTCGAE